MAIEVEGPSRRTQNPNSNPSPRQGSKDERYLGRRISSQSDELPTNGGQARTPSDRVVDGVPQTGPNRSEIASFLLF